MQSKHLKFENVKGYATYENAQKRGEAVAEARKAMDPRAYYHWVVIALPNGRFAPMAIINGTVPGGPGAFLGEVNLCMAN